MGDSYTRVLTKEVYMCLITCCAMRAVPYVNVHMFIVQFGFEDRVVTYQAHKNLCRVLILGITSGFSPSSIVLLSWLYLLHMSPDCIVLGTS